MEQQSAVQSLERAFSLLEALSRKPDGMQLTELAQVTGLHKSTVHRLLASLAALGYVKRPEEGGKYRLSLKLLELSGRLTENIDVLELARPHLEQLRDFSNETVHLVVRDGPDIVYIYKAESGGSFYRMFSRIGMRRPMYCTASGKSILATLSDEEVLSVWKQSEIVPFTEKTVVTLDRLQADLQTVRARGFAVDDEENEVGVRCVAAVIYDYTGKGAAAFSVSAPVMRMGEERTEQLAARVLETRGRISAELGYRP